MTKIMTNAEIYGLAEALNSAFNMEERYLPARINYFISKNKNILSQLAEDIEKVRKDIIMQYGTISEDGEKADFTPESMKAANQELADLLNVKQDVTISTIKLSELDKLDFSPKQMQALLFMIEED